MNESSLRGVFLRALARRASRDECRDRDRRRIRRRERRNRQPGVGAEFINAFERHFAAESRSDFVPVLSVSIARLATACRRARARALGVGVAKRPMQRRIARARSLHAKQSKFSITSAKRSTRPSQVNHRVSTHRNF